MMPVAAIVEGIVCYACITFRHRRRGWDEGKGLYEIAFTDGRRLFARTKPRFYNLKNEQIQPYDVAKGSSVRISTKEGWMNAVQVVSAGDDSPFSSIG